MTALPITLKVNNRTEFFALQDLLISSLIFIGLALFMLFYLDAELIFYILIVFYFFLFFLPVIILHSNYEKYNKDKILIFEQNKIIFDSQIINTDEITNAKIYGTNQSINKYSYAKSKQYLCHFSGKKASGFPGEDLPSGILPVSTKAL